jgi:hypothetical protein
MAKKSRSRKSVSRSVKSLKKRLSKLKKSLKRKSRRSSTSRIKKDPSNPCSMRSAKTCGGDPNCHYVKRRGCARKSGVKKGSAVFEGPMFPARIKRRSHKKSKKHSHKKASKRSHRSKRRSHKKRRSYKKSRKGSRKSHKGSRKSHKKRRSHKKRSHRKH